MVSFIDSDPGTFTLDGKPGWMGQPCPAKGKREDFNMSAVALDGLVGIRYAEKISRGTAQGIFWFENKEDARQLAAGLLMAYHNRNGLTASNRVKFNSMYGGKYPYFIFVLNGSEGNRIGIGYERGDNSAVYGGFYFFNDKDAVVLAKDLITALYSAPARGADSKPSWAIEEPL